jgi:DNA replication protein DnaC
MPNMENIYKERGIKPRWFNYNLSDLKGLDKLKQTSHEESIMLSGSFGVGKSMFLNVMFIDICKKIAKGEHTKISMYLTNTGELIKAYLRDEKKYEKLLSIDLVAVDDIDDVYLEGNAQKMGATVMNNFLRTRYDYNKATWMATNLIGEEQIEEKFGKKFGSFIFEAFTIYQLSSDVDKRKNMKKIITL